MAKKDSVRGFYKSGMPIKGFDVDISPQTVHKASIVDKEPIRWREIHVKVPDEVFRKAKAKLALSGRSISDWFRAQLARFVNNDDD